MVKISKVQKLKYLAKARRKWQNMSHSSRIKARRTAPLKYTNQGKLFKGSFHLPIETAVYIPSTNKSQKIIAPKIMSKRVTSVRKALSNKFGGYTSASVTGGYVMKSGKLVKEPVVKVTAFSTINSFKKNKGSMRKQLGGWKKKWGQESLGYEYEGDLYYV